MSCEKHEQPGITFLNLTGDITITWDEQNREKILEMVRKKMDEGYHFFTTKKVPLLRLYREVKVTEKNLEGIDKLIISDADFEAWAKSMDDLEVTKAVNEGHAHLSKRQSRNRDMDAVKRLTKAEEVLEEQSIAVRQIQGG